MNEKGINLAMRRFITICCLLHLPFLYVPQGYAQTGSGNAANHPLGAGTNNAAASWAGNRAAPLADDLLTVDGQLYKEVTLGRVEPDGISISYKPGGGGLGMAKLKFRNLPEKLQRQYHYDAQRASAYELQQEQSLNIVRAKMWADFRAECGAAARYRREQEPTRQGARREASRITRERQQAREEPSVDFDNRPMQSFQHAPAVGFDNRPMQSFNAGAVGFENRPMQSFQAPAAGFDNRPLQNFQAPAVGFDNRPMQSFQAPTVGFDDRPMKRRNNK